MAININRFATKILPSYNKSVKNQNISISKLSSGEKIIHSKDNPSALNRSELIRIKIRTLQVAQRNAQDGINLIQSADTALEEASGLLSDIKELCLKSLNTQTDLNIIQDEIEILKDNLNSLAKTNNFNNKNIIGDESILDNSGKEYLSILIGSDSENIKVPMYNINSKYLYNKDNTKNVQDINVFDKNEIKTDIETIENSLNTINSIRTIYGSIQNSLEKSYEVLDKNIINNVTLDSKIRDCDMALEYMNFIKDGVLLDSNASMISQTLNLSNSTYNILRNIK